MKHVLQVACFVLILFNVSIIYGQNISYVKNKGIGGNSSFDLLQRFQKDVLELKPDLVIVLVGTNDLMNSKKMVSVGQFMQNIERLADTLSFYELEVVIVSPPPVDEVFLFERHDSTLFLLPPNKILEHASISIRKMCQEKGYLFIDFFEYLNDKGIPNHNSDEIIINIKNSGLGDGVHLTKAGNQLLAQLIFDKMNDRYGALEELKIVCFGDSLTFGAYMEGAGTANGYTYPAILKNLINGLINY